MTYLEADDVLARHFRTDDGAEMLRVQVRQPGAAAEFSGELLRAARHPLRVSGMFVR